jgi:hypothetical protein
MGGGNGFTSLDIILMGADKVFIRSLLDKYVLMKVGETSDFFNHFFSSFVKWDKNVVPFQRGAWLRLYGIWLHAWNESFFKLHVLYYGRYLQTCSCFFWIERDLIMQGCWLLRHRWILFPELINYL